MVKYLRFTTFRNDDLIILLPEANPQHGLLLTDANGLGSDGIEASISTSEPAIIDGAFFNSARVGTRNIELTFTFTTSAKHVLNYQYLSEHIEDPRHLINRYFPLKKKLKIQAVTDRRNVFTYGYVESDEPDIWSDREETKVSIICPDPWWIDSLDPSIKMDLLADKPLFEFIFDSDLPWHWDGSDPNKDDGRINIGAIQSDRTSLSGKRIIFGDVFSGNWIIELDNPGDVEVGCYIDVVEKATHVFGEGEDKDLAILTSSEIPWKFTITNVTSRYVPRQDQNMSKKAQWKRLAAEIDTSIYLELCRSTDIANNPPQLADPFSSNLGGMIDPPDVTHEGNTYSICTIPGERSATRRLYDKEKDRFVTQTNLEYVGTNHDRWLTILPGKNYLQIQMINIDNTYSSVGSWYNLFLEFPVCYEGI